MGDRLFRINSMGNLVLGEDYHSPQDVIITDAKSTPEGSTDSSSSTDIEVKVTTRKISDSGALRATGRSV
jgi:hypothetical protein